MSQATARLPGKGWHLSISPTTLAKLDSVSATTLRVYCYAVSRDVKKCLLLRSQARCKEKPRPLHFSRKVMLDGIARGGAA